MIALANASCSCVCPSQLVNPTFVDVPCSSNNDVPTRIKWYTLANGTTHGKCTKPRADAARGDSVDVAIVVDSIIAEDNNMCLR